MTRKEDSKKGLTNGRKIFYSVLVISIAVFLISGIYAVHLGGGEDDPTAGFNIHVSVGRHDHANLDAQFDHYCKLTPPIVATCLLFAEGESGDIILSEVEYIITRDQYLQLPLRDRPNWHNHAVELTPERGMPRCVSLPEGLECGALVSILHQTYGKVVVLWDPSDPLPRYPPYNFLVDSPFALEQDLNHELHKIWEVGDESTSSANILPDDEDDGDEEDNDDGNGGECNEDLSISYSARDTGEIIQFNDLTNFESQRIDFFRGSVKLIEGDIRGTGGLSARATTNDGRRFNINAKFDVESLLEQDCDSVTWRNTARGNMWESGVGTKAIDFDFMDVTYDLLTGKIDAIAFGDDPEVVFEFEDMVDKNFG